MQKTKPGECIFLMALFLFCGSAYAQDAAAVAAANAGIRLSREIQGPYSLIERSDWSRYDNGKYIGICLKLNF
jgi:hypothetical protein